jgi:hypothetical protein|tara:strand:- start:2252 stop:2536 length:285 start_codon:yes stop_codon:yes gene_type:complete
MNGCGGKGSWIRPPYGKFYESSCNKHDKGYEKGGNELDRFECDAKFLVFMIKDTFRITHKINIIQFFVRVYYQFWAFIYFIGVRIGGKRYFNYK